MKPTLTLLIALLLAPPTAFNVDAEEWFAAPPASRPPSTA